MTTRLTKRLSFVAIAMVVLLALVAFLTFNFSQTTAYADDDPVSNFSQDVEYGATASALKSALESTGEIGTYHLFVLADDYEGTFTAALYESDGGAKGELLYDGNQDDFVLEYNVEYVYELSWTANGAYSAGSTVQKVRASHKAKIEHVFTAGDFNNSQYGSYRSKDWYDGWFTKADDTDNVYVSWYYMDGSDKTVLPANAELGTYTLTAELLGTDATKYELALTYPTGTSVDVTITAATLTVTPDENQSKIYGEDDPAEFTYTISGTQFSETPTFTGALSRNAGETYGTYAILQNTLALADDLEGADVNKHYVIAFDSHVYFSIERKELNITFDGNKVYNGESQKPSVVSIEGIVGDDEVEVYWSGGNTSTVGSWTGAWGVIFVFTGADKDNYTHATFKADLRITAKPVTLSWTEPESLVYSGEAKTVTATVTAGSICGDDEVTVTNFTDNTKTDVGSYTATATELSNANYTLTGGTNVTYAWAITKKRAIIIIRNAQGYYGDEPTAPVIEGDNNIIEADRGHVYEIVNEATVTSGVGDYYMYGRLLNGGDSRANNYDIDFLNNDLYVGNPSIYTVNQRAITVIINDKTSVYGEEKVALTSRVSSGTLVNDDPNPWALNCGITTTTDVGEYDIYGTTLNNNYNIRFINGTGTSVNGKYTVTKRTVTIKNNNDVAPTFAYGDPINVSPYDFLALDEYSAYGFANTDTIQTVVAIGLIYNGQPISINEVENVGRYYLSLSAFNDNNYTVVQNFNENSYLEITVRNIEIVNVNAAPIVYVYGNDFLPTFANPYAWLGVKAGSSLPSGTSIADFARFDLTLNGVVVNEFTVFGAYNFELTVAEGMEDNVNIVTDFDENAYVDYQRRTITVTPNANQGKVYGDADGVITYTLGNILPIDAEAVQLTGALSRAEGNNAGQYAITGGTLALAGGGANDNYVLSLVNNVMYTVNPKPLTVIADFKNSTYGDATVALTATLNTSLAYDDLEDDVFTLATTATAASPVYENGYPITVTPINENYEITAIDGIYIVTPRMVTVDYNQNAPKRATYGNVESFQALLDEMGNLGPYAYLTVNNLVNGDFAWDILSLQFAHNGQMLEVEDIDETIDAGIYVLLPSVRDGVINYAVNYGDNMVNAYVYVAQATLTVDAVIADTTYGTALVVPTLADGGITITSFVNGDTIALITADNIETVFAPVGDTNSFFDYSDEEMDEVIMLDAPTHAGRYYFVVVVGGLDNYEAVVVSKTFSINKLAVTVTAENKSGIYGKDIAALTATLDTALVDGDAQNAVFTLSTTATKTSKPGEYPISVVLSNNPDYEVTAVNGVYTITEAAPVVDETTGNTVYTKEIDVNEAKTNGADVTTLFKTAAQNVDQNKEVKIKVGNSTIVFNSSAVNAIARGDNVSVKVSTAVPDRNDATLPEGTKLVIDVVVDGATFADGKATVSVDFNEEVPNGQVAKVYFIDANGNKTDMKAKFENGKAIFEVNHFSKYVVVFEKTGSSSAALIVIICILATIAIATAVYFIIKKKGANNGRGTKIVAK